MVEIVGYGTGFRPVAPSVIGRLPGARQADTIVFARPTADSVANLLVVPGGRPATGPLRLHTADQGGLATYHDGDPDGPQVLLGVDVPDAADVAHAVAGSPRRDWSLRTDTYRIPWPVGTNVRSMQPGAPWPFELHAVDRDENAMVMVRGPVAQEVMNSPEAMIAPGQELVDGGATATTIWTELVYRVDGRQWWQRHEWVPLDEKVVVVTAQAPAGDEADLRQVLLPVVAGLERRRPDDEVAFALTR